MRATTSYRTTCAGERHQLKLFPSEVAPPPDDAEVAQVLVEPGETLTLAKRHGGALGAAVRVRVARRAQAAPKPAPSGAMPAALTRSRRFIIGVYWQG